MAQATSYLEREELDWSDNLDRRHSPRFPSNARVRCVPIINAADPPVWTAQVRDVSALGIGLLMAHGPGMSTLLEIEMTRKNGTPVRNMLARVVHEVRESGKSYVVGCAFVRELADEHLQVFQAGAVRPDGPDCRRWTRFPCNVETVCYTSETAPGERRSGKIINISAGGIGLKLRCQFSEGTLLHFELPQEMNLGHRQLLVRVVRAMEQPDGSWFLGCEFADQLCEDDLRDILR